MYYLFLGDRQKAYKKASEVANTLANKNIGINLVKISSNEYDDSLIVEHLNSQALFSSKNIILISGLVSEGLGDFLLNNLKELKFSENIFIIADSIDDKKTLEKIEKHAEKVQKFEEKQVKKREGDEIFEIANCFGRRDKKTLWKKYRELLLEYGASEILNIIIWQTKTIISAMRSSSGAEAGLAPFVYTKAKTFAKNFSEKEILDIYIKLVQININSFYSDEYIEGKLEKFFLEY